MQWRSIACSFVAFFASTSYAATVFGPEVVSVTGTSIVEVVKNIDLGSFPPGRYLLKVRNGDSGPYRSEECNGLQPEALHRQCLARHVVEKIATDFSRFEGFTFMLNGRKFSGNFVGRQFTYREILINLDLPVNELVLTYQGYPSSKLIYEIVEVSPGGMGPRAFFTVKQLVGAAPLSLTMNARESFDLENTALSYSWNLGDGQSATGKQVAHLYETPGSYTISLTVSNGKGGMDQYEVPVLVKESTAGAPANIAPVARFTSALNDINDHRRVSFMFDGSYDQDGIIETFEMQFGDGFKGIGSYVEHTYQQDGTYLVLGKVKDNQGARGQLEKSISVYNRDGVVVDSTVQEPIVIAGSGVQTSRTLNFSGDIGSLYKITVRNADGEPHQHSLCNGVVDYLLCVYENWVNEKYVDSNRMDWAHLYLNNRRITASGDIAKNKASYEAVVRANSSNNLLIQSMGKGTAFLDIKIEKLRFLPDGSLPEVIVSGWPDTGVVSDPDVSLQIFVTDSLSTVTKVFLNGSLVQTSGEQLFPVNLTLTEGENNLKVVATDQSGMESVVELGPLYLDTVPPEVSSLLPAEGGTLKTNVSTIWISGVASESLSAVNTNYGGLTIGEDGKAFSGFLYMYGLDGLREIELSLVDIAGNSKLVLLYVDIERNQPNISIQGLKPRHKDELMPVKIVVSDEHNASISVYINDVFQVTAPLKELNYNVPLSEDHPTYLKVIAIDEYGNSRTYESYSITIDRIPPTLVYTYPADGSTINSSFLEIGGRANEALSFASLGGFPLSTGGSDGGFSGVYPFSQVGPQEIVLLLRDVAGNETQITMNFNAQYLPDATEFVPWAYQECPLE